ncbi:Fc receptor-like protein 5 [Colossoma macropomum]|uniref:Fc receptor-like protein 5 n=1 Tax=Colossoma macropomum TaxID=42526 RepID=UPI0018648111|nr:Fc receptor-like protein 5 [Colossoma macropomum]
MEFRSLSVILLLIVLIHSGQTQDKPAVIIKDPPGRKEINIGETVTLKCEIPGGEGRTWTYSWFNNGKEVHRSEERSEYTFQMTADYSTEFTCKGTTRSSDPVKLSLSERPKAVVSIQPDDQVFRGETVTLRCDIQGEGVSNWQYSWFKDASSTPVSKDQQYRISSVTESHSGKYTCRGTERGTSRYSHTSDAVTLTVSALPRATLTVEPKWSPVFTGESVTLKCEIESYSNWRYQWYKGSSRTAVYQSQTNTFTIRSAADQDQGQYWCKGQRDNRPSSSQPSNPVTLTVKERPKAVVSIQPDDQVFRGETVSLRCDIQGEGVSDWQHSWFKDDSYRAVSNEQQYRISSVTESHSGKYTCRGTERRTSRYSHTSEAVTLTVSASPRATLTVEPKWSPVFTGESVTLKCEIESYSNWRYQWYKGSSRTAVSQSQTNTFTIRSAADQDQYWCRGERYYRPSSSQLSNPVTVTVKGNITAFMLSLYFMQCESCLQKCVVSTKISLPRATLAVEPKWSPVFTGESVTLKCEIEPHSNWRYQWYKGSSRTAVSQSQTNTFTIRSAADQDQYWCRGERDNRPSSSQPSNPVTLAVRALPRATLTVEPRWSPVFTGESVTLKCEIESYSDWRYQWYKGSSRTAVYQSQTNTFSIRSAAGLDQDQYWCRGESYYRPSSSERSNTVTLTVKERPKAVVSIQPDDQVFRGETVTLRCDIQGEGVSNWQYSWFKDDSSTPVRNYQQYRISSVTESHRGKYTCRGTERGTSRYSHTSDAVTLTVSAEKPKPELTSSHKEAALIGNPVVLYCKLDQVAGWTFYWFKHTQNPENEIKTETHSYTISSVSVSDGGQYWCRAGRGDPVYYTHYSDALWINITGASRPDSLMVSPSRTQHFITDSLSLSCEGQSDSTGWRVRRYTHSEKVSDCSSGWGSVTGSTCSISSLYTSHTGVYWCESESGESSNPVNITVTNGSVILDSPVHPVTEGDPLTLHCLYRDPKPSNLTAEFYKNGSLLQTTGEMTIHTVSKSDEGVYHCKHPEKGESPQSWMSVRGASSSSVFSLLSSLMAVSPYLLVTIVLAVKFYRAQSKPDEETRTYAVTEAGAC